MKIIVETEQLFSGVHSASIDDEIRHKLDEWGGKIKEINGFDEVSSMQGVLDCDLMVGVGGNIKPVKTGLDRAGFIIAAAETRNEAIRLADKAEKEIEYILENV